MNAIVFDTQALLIFYLGEPGAGKVEDYLNRVLGKEIEGLCHAFRYRRSGVNRTAG